MKMLSVEEETQELAHLLDGVQARAATLLFVVKRLSAGPLGGLQEQAERRVVAAFASLTETRSKFNEAAILFREAEREREVPHGPTAA